MAVKDILKERVKAPDAVLEQAVLDAEGAILDICHRITIPANMVSLQVALAAVYAQRILAAGEESRAEGEVDVTYAYAKDIPEDIMKRMLARRKLKQAGIANDTKKS